MPRPTVRIETANKISGLRAHLDRQVPRFAALPGVVGITLNGGLSRGYADELSEIDVTCYLTSDAYRQWQAGGAPFGTGIQMIDGALYDLKAVDLREERIRDWEMVTLWDASYAEILHDPSGEVAALHAAKLAQPPGADTAAGPLFAAWWYFELAGNIWIHRADPLQGQLMLNQAVMELVKALFLANGEYVPHDKWLIHLSRSLEWTPPDWDQRLTSAICDIRPTVKGLRLRQQHIAALWDDIDRHTVTICVPGYPDGLQLPHLSAYKLLGWLVASAPVSISAWQDRAGLDILNGAPFNVCVKLHDGQVILDRDRLARLTSAEVYTWHYAIVEAARARNRETWGPD